MSVDSKMKAGLIRFSLSEDDHISAMKTEVDFLCEVSKYPLLYTPGPVLNNAIRRYETLFLPAVAMASTPVYGAPLDIQWIWHCHMLAPIYYQKDCEKIVGRVPDHLIKHESSVAGTSEALTYLWDKHVPKKEPLEVDLQTKQFVEVSEYVPQCSYDLVGAVQRQSAFYYNVSLPHYKDDGFLSKAIQRYKMMLHLKKLYSHAFLVPCYDMDLAWHTHQLHPHFYKNDTTEYLGKIFNHDDNMTDRSAESHLTKSEENTKELWKLMYEEHMAASGAMYRGVSPVGKLVQLTDTETFSAGEFRFDINIETIEANCKRASKLRLEIFDGKVLLSQEETKKLRVGSSKAFIFSPFDKTIIFDDLRWKVFTLALTKIQSGCFTPFGSQDVGSVNLKLGDYLKDGLAGPADISLQSQLGESTLSVLGSVGPPKPDLVIFQVQASPFSNVVMPEHLEELWGPIPLRRLSAGAINHCTVADHKLVKMKGGSTFTVRVIHCLPLLMSCVQIFYRDKMVAVSHLVGTDQVPDDTGKEIKHPLEVVLLKRSIGERGMLIKTAQGDRIFVFGHWANMKRGIPAGTSGSRATPGSPGNLKIRVCRITEDGKSWQNGSEQSVQSGTIDIADTFVILSGRVRIAKSENIPEKLCLAFSVAVLTCLCQPPPPHIRPTIDASKLGVLQNPPKYQFRKRGNRPIIYMDGADQALVVAAGWLMPCPSNYYMRNHWRVASGSSDDYDGYELAECAACGGEAGNVCACAGEGGSGVSRDRGGRDGDEGDGGGGDGEGSVRGDDVNVSGGGGYVGGDSTSGTGGCGGCGGCGAVCGGGGGNSGDGGGGGGSSGGGAHIGGDSGGGCGSSCGGGGGCGSSCGGGGGCGGD